MGGMKARWVGWRPGFYIYASLKVLFGNSDLF